MKELGNIVWFIGVIGWLITILILPSYKYLALGKKNFIMNINATYMWIFVILIWLGIFMQNI